MSFMDAYKDKNPQKKSAAYRDNPGLEEVQSLAGVVFQLTTSVSSFKRMVDSLGTPKDTAALRNRLRTQRESLQTGVKDTSTRLKELNNQAAEGQLNKNVQTSHAKLVKDFHSVLKDFQRTQRECMEREAMYDPVEDEPMRESKGFGGLLGASSSRAQQEEQALLEPAEPSRDHSQIVRLDNEIEYNNAVIEEREQGINEITQQIHEVNEIFQDLAVLVNEQGGMLEDIEANIVKTNMKVNDARGELKKAEKNQRSSRSKMICMMITMVIVLAIIVVIVLKLLG